MFESTKTTSLMEFLATQGVSSEGQRSGKQPERSFACHCVLRVVGDQLPQFVREQRADAASPACRNGTGFFQQRRVDRHRNVVFGCHCCLAVSQFEASRKIREDWRQVKRILRKRLDEFSRRIPASECAVWVCYAAQRTPQPAPSKSAASRRSPRGTPAACGSTRAAHPSSVRETHCRRRAARDKPR